MGAIGRVLLIVGVVWVGCARGEREERESHDASNRSLMDARMASDAQTFVDAPNGHQGPINLLADGDFELSEHGSGVLNNRCHLAAPWGQNSWGIEAFTFHDPGDRSIDQAIFGVADGYASLSGVDNSGGTALVRFIQGDIWGGSHCGAIGWNRFSPAIRTSDGDLIITIEVTRGATELSTVNNSRVRHGVNLWLDAPTLPSSVSTVTGRKPLVLDLIVSWECNRAQCEAVPSDDAFAFHYPVVIGASPQGATTIWRIPLREHIIAAATEFSLDSMLADTTTVMQVEYVVELVNARASAELDNFVLTRVSETM